jgi:hypothetical protein
VEAGRIFLGLAITGVAFLAGGRAPDAAGAEMTASEIAAANARGIAAVRSIVADGTYDMEMTGSLRVPRNTTACFTWTWQKGELRSQCRQRQALYPIEAGSAQKARQPLRPWNFSDCYNGKKGFKVLQGYNPDEPSPVLTETEPGKISGIIDATQSNPAEAILYHPDGVLLFVLGGGDEMGTLSQLIAKCGGNVVEKPSDNNQQCYVLMVDLPTPRPNPSTVTFDAKGNVIRPPAVGPVKLRLKIAVDQAHGFLVRSVTRFIDDKRIFENEVLTFAKSDDGAFCPKNIRFEVQRAPGHNLNLAYLDLAIRQFNKDIPAEAFEVKFPEWLRVADRQNGRVYLWGNDGPQRTFKSDVAYRQWEKATSQKVSPLPLPYPKPPRVGRGMVVIAPLFGLVSLVLVGRRVVWLWRKKWLGFNWLDLVLLLAAVGLAVAVVMLAWPMLPVWGSAAWRICRAVLRFWKWPWWVWTTLCVVAFCVLAWLRSRQA